VLRRDDGGITLTSESGGHRRRRLPDDHRPHGQPVPRPGRDESLWNAFGSVRQRVAAHLLDLASAQQQPRGRLVAHAVSQRPIADIAPGEPLAVEPG
jgi:hypothetical protein